MTFTRFVVWLVGRLVGWLVFSAYCSNGKPGNAGFRSNDKQGRKSENKFIFTKVSKGKR